MKKIKILLITVLLTVSTILLAQTNATTYRVDKIYQGVCDVLRMNPEVTICYTPKRAQFKVTGITIKNHNGSYTIHLKRAMDNKEWKRALIHEMIHVFQMENGSIEIIDGRKYWYGFILIHGERYEEYNQLHEMQARDFTERISNIILRRGYISSR